LSTPALPPLNPPSLTLPLPTPHPSPNLTPPLTPPPKAGITFLSAVGSEFVEMFAGVAAARVNSLYYSARKKVGGFGGRGRGRVRGVVGSSEPSRRGTSVVP
jgi:hypothetical protein